MFSSFIIFNIHEKLCHVVWRLEMAFLKYVQHLSHRFFQLFILMLTSCVNLPLVIGREFVNSAGSFSTLSSSASEILDSHEVYHQSSIQFWYQIVFAFFLFDWQVPIMHDQQLFSVPSDHVIARLNSSPFAAKVLNLWSFERKSKSITTRRENIVVQYVKFLFKNRQRQL